MDAVPYLNGEDGDVNWTADSAQYRAFVAAMETVGGLEWGGSWKSIGDDDHFRVPGLPYTPTAAMQADYKDCVSLANIWAKVTAGEYGKAATA